MEKLNLIVVFIEGVLSFLSPCILPILPIYLSMLSNSSIENLKNDSFLKNSLFKNTIFFVLGISTTFFILGSSINALSTFLNSNKDLIMIVGGIIIVFMGLFYMDIMKSNLLNKEKRFKIKSKKMNLATSFLLGFTFSFGWTPCIGPMLASVLIMSSSSSSISIAYLLIAVYTIGFILPFIIMSLFYNKLINRIDKIKNHTYKIKKVGGWIIVISGVIMLSNGISNKLDNYKSQNQNKVENNQSLNNQEEKQEKEKIKALDFT
ncbi:MAG: cytochrome c biogenesis CcdA family protein, partial [Paraclostridium sp.]